MFYLYTGLLIMIRTCKMSRSEKLLFLNNEALRSKIIILYFFEFWKFSLNWNINSGPNITKDWLSGLKISICPFCCCHLLKSHSQGFWRACTSETLEGKKKSVNKLPSAPPENKSLNGNCVVGFGGRREVKLLFTPMLPKHTHSFTRAHDTHLVCTPKNRQHQYL